MKKKIRFQKLSKKEMFKFLKTNKKRKTLNFLNLHDIYQFNKEEEFQKSLLKKEGMNFIDGFAISLYLSIINFKKIVRVRGPTFTRDFLLDKDLPKNKSHFFIGLEKDDIRKLKEKIPNLKAENYNPPYIKKIKFPKKEINKIANLINKKRSDYVWVGIGCPKQNILSNELFEKTKAQYFVNIGAALDFLLDKKQEAPLIVRELGVEWLYRLVTDFKYSRKKVWRSFLGLGYIIRKIDLD
ncbi:WecB/TagA/CpsF family glycosyltransferase [Methanococcoides sp. SA1]|nr:WecB/TagA/CpsF family glycosyltransferase [Methanococcoides sp. SA1]